MPEITDKHLRFFATKSHKLHGTITNIKTAPHRLHKVPKCKPHKLHESHLLLKLHWSFVQILLFCSLCGSKLHYLSGICDHMAPYGLQNHISHKAPKTTMHGLHGRMSRINSKLHCIKPNCKNVQSHMGTQNWITKSSKPLILNNRNRWGLT